MPLPQGMSQEEYLAIMGLGAKSPNASPEELKQQAKDLHEEFQRKANAGWKIPVVGKMPDPEAVANSQIDSASSGGMNRAVDPNQLIADHITEMKKMQQVGQGNDQERQALQQAIQSRASNPVNPETGMPFYSKPAEQSPEDDEKRREMQMKADFLRKRSMGQ